MRRSLAVLVSLLLAVPSSSFAQSFKILGTRPLGMGGAHVAAAEGALAQYWNPAGLAVQKSFELNIPVGAGAEFSNDLLKEADELSALSDKIDAIQAKVDASAMTLADYDAFLETMVQLNDLNKEGLGLLAEGQGGANVRAGRFAVSMNNFTEIGVDPYVDTFNMGLSGGSFGAGVDAVSNDGTIGGNANATDAGHETQLANVLTAMSGQLGLEFPGGATAAQIANELIAQAEAGGQSAAQVQASIEQIAAFYAEASAFLPNGLNPFNENLSSLTLQGASVTELSLGWGGGVPILGGLPFLKRFSVGGNVKLQKGSVGYGQIRVMDEDVEMDDLQDDYRKNVKDSNALAFDVGAMFDVMDTPLKSRFGLVARNVNKPSFEQPEIAKAAGLDKYELAPQVRAGWAWRPLNWLVFAADVDLTENKTSLPGYKSRLAGGGMEINVFNRPWINLALRGGLMRNIAESDSALAYTGGLGLNLLHFYVELGAAVSSETVKIEDGDEIPSSIRGAVNIGLRF